MKNIVFRLVGLILLGPAALIGSIASIPAFVLKGSDAGEKTFWFFFKNVEKLLSK